MQVGTISKRTIIRRTAVMLLCGAAGWYLKAKLTPQMPMMGMNMGDPYVLVQQVQQQDISPKKAISAMFRRLMPSICARRLPDMLKKFCFRKARW